MQHATTTRRPWWTHRDSWHLLRGMGRSLVIGALAQLAGYDIFVVWPELALLMTLLAIVDILVDRLFDVRCMHDA